MEDPVQFYTDAGPVSKVTHLKQKEREPYVIKFLTSCTNNARFYTRVTIVFQKIIPTLSEKLSIYYMNRIRRLSTQPQQREYVTPELRKNTLRNIHGCILPIQYSRPRVMVIIIIRVSQNRRTERVGSFKRAKNAPWELDREPTSRHDRYQAVKFNFIIVARRYSYT